MSIPAMLVGALVAAGVVVLVRELLPARPDVGAVLDRLERTEAPVVAQRQHDGVDRPMAERIGERVLRSVGDSVTVPRRDLDLLGKPVAEHVGTKILAAVGGFLLPQLYLVLSALLGMPASPGLPLAFSLLCAIGLWVNADLHVKQQAKKARLEFRYATVSFLRRARLERAAASGAEGAVHQTARVGDGWVFDRIREALHRAELTGMPPWEALRDLGERLEVPELAAPAETFALAGGGAQIDAVLATQAKSMRERLQAEKLAEANAASEKAVVPATVLFLVTFCVLAAPALASMMTT